MSDLSQMSARFESESKKLASDTTRRVQSALEQHESALIACLNTEQQRIETAIHAHTKRMNRLMLRSWLGLSLMILVTLFTTAGWAWWQGQTIAQQNRVMNQNRQILRLLANYKHQQGH